MTRMYKVDGQWKTYQDLHDSDGYTLTPSIPISYISSNEPTWGEDYGEHGYYTGLADDDDEYDPTQGEYFAVDIFGWYSLNEMSSEVLLMPSNADPTLFFSNGVITCKAAKITLPRDPDLYLLADETQILNGWHTLEWWQEHGWDEAQPVTSALFGGDFSGNNITLDSVDGGGNVINRYNPGRSLFPNTGFVEGAMIARHGNSRALFELRGWEPGGYWSDGISIYYLTSQGAASTTDFGLSSDATYDLYDASGHTVVDRWNNHFIISANRITEGFPEDWTTEELEFLSVIVASPYYGYILQLKTGSTRPYYNAIYSLSVKSIAPPKPVADALNITVEPIEPQFSNFIQNEPLGIL